MGAETSAGLTTGGIMVFGMSLANFTLLHVVVSLIGIAVGLVTVVGMLTGRPLPGWTALFLATTILTSVTGFFFPVEKLLPSHVVGIISCVLLAVACFALYGKHMSGWWRPVYVVTAMASLYLNVFVGVIQSFLKIGPLHTLAPTVPPSGLVFAVAQGVVLLFFIGVSVVALKKFRPEIIQPSGHATR
jgi:hypothetical protein